MTAASAGIEADTTRLHISPFNTSIYDQIVPAAIRSSVIAVSFHKTQSDPDRGFGYIELPTTAADRIKKKFHGTTLRGCKMAVEKAKPEKRKRAAENDAQQPKKKSMKKSKRDKTAIEGGELSNERKVKRGWTDPKAKPGNKDKNDVREKSRYTDKEELLFRTGKTAKPTKDKAGKTKKSNKEIIHEFEGTTKFPTFLKAIDKAQRTAPLSYTDGIGWTDDQGNVVEGPVKSARLKSTIESNSSKPTALGIQGLPAKEHAKVEVASNDSSSSSSESDESSDTSDSSNESDEDGDRTSERSAGQSVEAKARQGVSSEPSKIAAVDEVGTPPSSVPLPSTELSKAVHPLEALYKRRPDELPRPAPIKTSFSFFEGGDDDEPAAHVASSTNIPQTPFTQADLRFRGLRSAAPTPDTAVASKRFFGSLPPADDDDDEEPSDVTASTEGQTARAVSGTPDANKERSAMVKEFYERRSELNSSWKQRRRESLKQIQQREGRRLTSRLA